MSLSNHPISYADAQDALNRADVSGLTEFPTAVLRNVMIEPLEVYLRYFGLDLGLNIQVKFGEYDNIFQEAVGGRDDLLNAGTRLVLVFTRLEGLSWDLARDPAGLGPEGLRAEIDRIKGFIDAVPAGIRGRTEGLILWHGFEAPVWPGYGVYDAQTDRGQAAAIRELNEHLRQALQAAGGAYLVDLNPILARLGEKDFYDPRLWHIGRMPYTREAMRRIAIEETRFIRPLVGRNKKCLVLDCDNTLWGGIVGEDGPAGIKIGRTHPGSAYWEFQQEALNLYHRGIILAICSKNNEADVFEVLDDHPDMLLRKEHFAAMRIDWNDKASNLREIARELNIGLDSLVFMDDNEFEIELVRRELPEVTAVHLPKDRAVQYRDILASLGLFDTLTVSDEDRKRGAMYRAEAGRKRLQAAATDMDGYYRSLEMVLEIRSADEFTVPRAAQMTQKTNQFNLTTRRYGEAEIRAMVESGRAEVIWVRLADRFGDSGLIGLCILLYEGDLGVLDTFLMSCRALGRGVEDALLVRVLARAKARGCRKVLGRYIPTRKNAQVERFYPDRGFVLSPENPAGEGTLYEHRLETIGPEPDHFMEIRSDI